MTIALFILQAGSVIAHPTSTGSTWAAPGENAPWWENWIRDKNHNGIDDALENYLSSSNHAPDDLIVVFVDFDHLPTPEDEAKLTLLGCKIQYTCKYINTIVAEVRVGQLGTITSLKEVVMIQYAPEGEFTLASSLPTIGVPEVWQRLGYDGEGVTIAIADTGIDDEHVGLDDIDDDPTTNDPKVIAFYDAQNDPDFDNGSKEPYDNNGHGTHVAGTAAGTGAPDHVNIGVAPKATLVGIKIGSGSIPPAAAMRGVEWAITNKDKFGIDILSNSWGYYIGTIEYMNGQSDISQLMDAAVDAGIVVLVAAGNTAVSLTVYAPGDSEKAITVGSVNDGHMLSIFSSQGPTADGRIKPDICAVGESVTAPRANTGNGYITYDGTSMACPMAAGVAALMLQANPDLEPDDVKQIMHESSEHNTDARFPTSPNNGYGWGVVEALGAVKRSRDLAMTYFVAPSRVHEGDDILFKGNTTYTRTEFTTKGLDGMRLVGDDELIFQISIPATWGPPVNITATAVGDLAYTASPSLRFENGRWIIEAEYHYTEDVSEFNESTPIVIFEADTPGVDFDTEYTFFMNITLNGMNATKVAWNITVDNQEPPTAYIDNPKDGESVSGIVLIEGTAMDPDTEDFVDQVQVKINDMEWQNATGTSIWQILWNTTTFNNGWYTISVRAYDGEEYSEIKNISVRLDNLNIQPQAFIDSISPSPANQDEEVSFSGHGQDSDGYITEFEWSSNIDGILSTSDIFSSSALSMGVHAISFRVKDNDGTWSLKDQWNLRINQIPVAQIDSVSPNPATEGDNIFFEGHGLDDRSVVAYNWRSSLLGFLSDQSWFNAVLAPGNHQIYFRVQDDDGVWSQEVSMSLRINGIPKAVIDLIAPNPAHENELVTLSGHGEDDGSIVAYEWNSSKNGLLGTSSSISTPNLDVGEHTISLRVRDNEDIWSNYSQLILEILPVPVAVIDLISPNPANESQIVSFTGHGEGMGVIVNYSWRSSLDGFLANSASFSKSTLSGGIHSIFFSVQNDKGVWSSEVSSGLRINGGPMAIIDSISPNPALLGEPVEFMGHGTDDSGVVNCSWVSSIDGFLSNMFIFTTASLSSGSHDIVFAVQDTDFVWSQYVHRTIKVHKRPVAVIDSISPNPANENEEVRLNGHGTDDGSVLAYEWSSNRDGFLSNLKSFSTSYLSNGDHNISFRVMDNDGIWSNYTFKSIRINQIPVAQIDYINPSLANEGDMVSLKGRGIDDGPIKSYLWTSSINGLLSSFAIFSTNMLSVGNHTLSFSVEDEAGVWSDKVYVTIRINQIPLAHIQEVSPLVPNEGELVNFKGAGSDDGSITAFNWTSSLDGFLSSSDSFGYSGLSVGEHVITFRVRDNDGVWSEGIQRTIRINMIPTATILQINPNPALAGQEISFIGKGIDEGNIQSYQWTSNIDGLLSSSETFVWYGLSPGQHTITLKVMDNNGMWSEPHALSLLVHSAPIARILTITPDSPNENDMIWFEGEGLDDGYIAGYKWESNIDGEIGDEESCSTHLSQGSHTISFSVMDNNNVWSKVVQRKVTVNGIPRAFIDYVYPNPVNEGETVTLKGHGIDDGFITSYQWSSSINGIFGSKDTVMVNDLVPGSHTIGFMVKDNQNVWSSEVYIYLTVLASSNIPPTVTIISPNSGEKVEDSVYVQVEAEDELDEIARIEIRIDDSNWFKISDSGKGHYTLDTSDLGEGKHAIYARAYDGELFSSEEFVLIEVQKTKNAGSFEGFDFSFFFVIGLILIPIIAGILLYYILVVKKRKKRDFIRL